MHDPDALFWIGLVVSVIHALPWILPLLAVAVMTTVIWIVRRRRAARRARGEGE